MRFTIKKMQVTKGKFQRVNAIRPRFLLRLCRKIFLYRYHFFSPAGRYIRHAKNRANNEVPLRVRLCVYVNFFRVLFVGFRSRWVSRLPRSATNTVRFINKFRIVLGVRSCGGIHPRNAHCVCEMIICRASVR